MISSKIHHEIMHLEFLRGQLKQQEMRTYIISYCLLCQNLIFIENSCSIIEANKKSDYIYIYILSQILSIVSIVSRGTRYEAQQSSKAITKEV